MGELDNFPTSLANIQPIREILYEYLRTAIIEKRLQPGQKMVEREIADRFQVSRTPVREALQKLETEGFLERKKSKSFLVRSVAYEEVQEAYMIRLALEPLMVQASVRNITVADCNALAQILDEAEQFHASENSEKVSEKLLEFDLVLMNISRLPKLKEILLGLQGDMRRFRRSNLFHKARRIDAVHEHRGILQAIKDGDEKLAAQRTREHIQGSRDELNTALKQNSG